MPGSKDLDVRITWIIRYKLRQSVARHCGQTDLSPHSYSDWGPNLQERLLQQLWYNQNLGKTQGPLNLITAKAGLNYLT